MEEEIIETEIKKVKCHSESPFPFRNSSISLMGPIHDVQLSPTKAIRVMYSKQKRTLINSSPEIVEDNDFNEYNNEICQLMNEFYYSPDKSKTKIKNILEEVKLLDNKNVANSIFISIYHNIKAFIKKKRSFLHEKLFQLKLYKNINTIHKRMCSLDDSPAEECK